MSAPDPAPSTDSIGPRPHASVETAFLPPDAVLFDDRHGEIHHLNASASAVWLMIDGELTIPEIATELGDIFSVATDLIRPDVEAAVEDFRHRGLLDGSVRHDEATTSDSRSLEDGAESVNVPDVPQRLDVLGRPPDT